MSFKKIGSIIITCLSVLATKAFAADTYSVLAYHSVVDESAPKDQRLYVPQTISAEHLISHFNWFKSQGYNVVSWQQIIDAEKGKSTLPEKAIVISFDDGYETMYSVIYPLLKAYNYPAVFAPVTSWINVPMNGKVDYGKEKLDRGKYFATWAQIDEMQNSGLVEIASHTHDLHYGVPSNPAGSRIAAMVAPIYKNGKYETEAQYKSRLAKDLKLASRYIAKNVGVAPRIMVWPYGAFNDTSVQTAKDLGMSHHFTLKEKINRIGDTHVGRFLVDAESNFSVINEYLNRKTDFDTTTTVERTLHINLDFVYDADPKIFQKNYDALIRNVWRQGVTAVYLKAFSDIDQDGIVDAAYFPNKHLPVKADIFSQVAWQLRTRSEVKVYSWIPASLESLPPDLRNVATMKDMIKDLSLYSKTDGIFFDGEVTPGRWADNGADSIALTKELISAAKPYLFFGTRGQTFTRNINPADARFAENLKTFGREYDNVLVDIRPYSLGGTTSPSAAKQWLNKAIKTVKESGVSGKKVAYNFSVVNPETMENVPTHELIGWMRILEENGIMDFGYYPGKYLFVESILKTMKPHVSANTDIRRK